MGQGVSWDRGSNFIIFIGPLKFLYATSAADETLSAHLIVKVTVIWLVFTTDIPRARLPGC